MSLVIYNTLTKQEEEFVPITPGEVKMYTCGPTVYGRPHIGNYSSFLMADLLRRWLEVSGYKVTHAKNITDVGHLAGDDTADATGEDKIERQAKQEQVDPLDIARKYTEEYLEDEQALNLIEPEHRPRATEVIAGMLDMVKDLVGKGNAYETDDGFYFDVRSNTPTPYGALSGNSVENLCAGSRIDVNEQKQCPADFALWKKCVGENSHHILRWSFETGERLSGTDEDASAGFPGWHIECSVMSSQLLGAHFDVHTGGEDLIFPHHECEIAQSECFSGQKSVNYWLHKRFIDMGDEKMSKSLGNVLYLSDIADMGFSPLDLRYALMSVHYRTQLKFTPKVMEDAHKARRKIVESFERLEKSKPDKEKSPGEVPDQIRKRINWFTDAMNDDLNTPKALGIVFDLITFANAQIDDGVTFAQETLEAYQEFIDKVRHTFGCLEPESEDIPADVQELLDQRAQARADKDYAKSDELRDQIRELGYEVRDQDGEQTVKKL